MNDPTKHPRVRALLDQAGKAHRLRIELAERAEPTAEVDEAMDSIFRDLGRALFDVARSPTQLIPDADDDDPTAFTSEIDADESWYTDELVSAGGDGPLFGEDDLDDHTDLPESDDGTPDDDGASDAYDVLTIVDLRARRQDATDALARLASGEAPPWGSRLRELLGLLQLPADGTDPQELSVEASRVQWAAGELEPRLAGLPESVQLVILAMLAARAHHLRQHVDVEVGPKMALDRLRRYRIASELPLLHGLQGESHPVGETWLDDAKALWLLLEPNAR